MRPYMTSPSGRAAALAGALLVLWLGALPAVADTATPLPKISRDDPEQMLQQATSELLAISKAAHDYIDTDRQRYYDQVSAVLEQVVDIHYFARGVMATYASTRLYRSLKTDAERVAFRERVDRFEANLKKVWMTKYADALLKAGGETIELERVNLGNDSGDRASLQQTIHDKDGQTYLIQYSLHTGKDGKWLITNVIVEGVNLGETYRSQFAEAVEKHHGDVDYVVDHWVDLMLHTGDKADAGADGSPA